MALTARNQVAAPVHGKPCSIATVYEAVADNPAELRELNAILYEESNSKAQVFAYLTNAGGFTIGLQSINIHRGGHCRCFRYAPFNFCSGCHRDLPSCACESA